VKQTHQPPATSHQPPIRIANGQGFWGDWLEAPVRLVDGGPIDYLTLDYLAEVTMSILQKQRQQDPELGYARDFPPLIGRIAASSANATLRSSPMPAASIR